MRRGHKGAFVKAVELFSARAPTYRELGGSAPTCLVRLWATLPAANLANHLSQPLSSHIAHSSRSFPSSRPYVLVHDVLTDSLPAHLSRYRNIVYRRRDIKLEEYRLLGCYAVWLL
jgi:hypothetical protein